MYTKIIQVWYIYTLAIRRCVRLALRSPFVFWTRPSLCLWHKMLLDPSSQTTVSKPVEMKLLRYQYVQEFLIPKVETHRVTRQISWVLAAWSMPLEKNTLRLAHEGSWAFTNARELSWWVPEDLTKTTSFVSPHKPSRALTSSREPSRASRKLFFAIYRISQISISDCFSLIWCRGVNDGETGLDRVKSLCRVR